MNISIIHTESEMLQCVAEINEMGDKSVVLPIFSYYDSHAIYNQYKTTHLSFIWFSTPTQCWVAGVHHIDLPKTSKRVFEYIEAHSQLDHTFKQSLTMDKSSMGVGLEPWWRSQYSSESGFFAKDVSYCMEHPHLIDNFDEKTQSVLRDKSGVAGSSLPIYSYFDCLVGVDQKIRTAYENQKHLWNDSAWEFYSNTVHQVLKTIENFGISTKLESSGYRSLVHTKYNPYTKTSRPSNVGLVGGTDKYNFAAIHEADKHKFVPSVDHKIYLNVDFKAFHVNLLLKYLREEIVHQDFHEYVAKEVFPDKNPLDKDVRQEVKKIIFGSMYKKDIKEKEHIGLENISFFKKIENVRNDLMNQYKKNGYIFSAGYQKPIFIPSDRVHEGKIMSYFVQNLETEIMIWVLNKIFNSIHLSAITPVLYTYDSILFEVYEKGFKKDIEPLIQILNNLELPYKIEVGESMANLHALG